MGGANCVWADAVSATQTISADGKTSEWTNITASVTKNSSLGSDGLYFDAITNNITSSPTNVKNGNKMYVKVPSSTVTGTIQIIASDNQDSRTVYLGDETTTTIKMHKTTGNSASFTSSHIVSINGGYYIKVNSTSDFKFSSIKVTLTSGEYEKTFSSGWGNASTARYQLLANKTMHIKFHNTGGNEVYYNWILAAGINNENNSDYLALRADGYDIKEYILSPNSNSIRRITDENGTEIISDFNQFKNDMQAGADVDIYVSNSGGKLYVNATTVANGHTYYLTAETVAKTYSDAYISLMGENCTLSNITFYDPVEACQITAAQDANGTSVSLKNKNGMDITSGIYVQKGEDIIFTSKANTNYEFNNWSVTGTTGTPSVDGDNDIYTVYSIAASTSITANYKTKAAGGGKTTTDLVLIPETYTASNVYSFVPTETLVTGTLYSDNHILGFGGNSYQNGMGVTVKGSGRYIAIKVNSGAHIQVTGYRNGSSSDRRLYIGTSAGGSQLAESPIFATGETRTLNATATADNQVIYISANSQDMYVKQITVFYGSVAEPTYSIASGTVARGSAITLSTTNGTRIYGLWTNTASANKTAEEIKNDASAAHVEGDAPLTVYPEQVGDWYLHTVAEKLGVLSSVASSGKYTINAAYTVTFNGNGGQFKLGDDDEVDYGNTLTEASVGAGITLPSASKAGVTFLGWGTTAGATTPNAGLAGVNYKPSADVTLYAVFTPVGQEWSIDFADSKFGSLSDKAGTTISTKQTATVGGTVFGTVNLSGELDPRLVLPPSSKWIYRTEKTLYSLNGSGTPFAITSCQKGQLITIDAYTEGPTSITPTVSNAVLCHSDGTKKIYRIINDGSVKFDVVRYVHIKSISVSNPTNYAITKSSTNGSIILKDEDNNTIEGTSVPEYSTVKITTEPSATYKLESITVKKTSDATDITSSVYKNSVLTMPSYNVTITATFTQGCPSVGQDGYHDVSTNGTVGTGSNAFLKNFSQFFTLEKDKNYYFNFVNKGNSDNTGSFQNWFVYAVSSQVHPGDGAWNAKNHEMLVLRADGVIWGKNKNESSRTFKRIAENGDETTITIPSGSGGLTGTDLSTFTADMVNADVHVGVTFTGTQLKVKAKMVSSTGNTYILEETTSALASALDQIYMFFGTEKSQITGLTDREVNFAEDSYEKDLIDVEWTSGMPTIAGATYTCSNQKVVKVNETTGALKFINTGLTSVTATIKDVISDTYMLTVKAEDATDELKYIQNAGAGYTTSYKVTGAGKLVNKSVNATNISMTYGTSNHIAIVRNLNSILGASVIDNKGELNASLIAGKPSAGTFYTFKPALPGTLQIKGYFHNNGSHAAQLFLDDDMSVKATIAYQKDGPATSDIISLQGGKTYYLYVDPTAANSGDYFCLTSFEYTSNLKFDVLATTITKVSGTTQYNYSQAVTGVSGNTVTYSTKVIKDNASTLSASVDNSGNVTITSSEDKDGGAVIVTATIDGTASISYVINVPYIGKHTWDFVDGMADKQEIKQSSLWNLTYEFRHTSDTDGSIHAVGQHGSGCLNVGVVSLQAKVEQDNAKYIGETNGLLINADYGRLGLGANLSAGHDTYAERSNATIADVIGIKRVDLCSGTKMTIPQVKSGWYVKVYWRPHAGKGSGSCIKAENVTDLRGVEIVDPFKVYGLTDMGTYYRGCTVFRVKRDASNNNNDVSFTIQNAPWGWNQIAKIEISDEFSSEMRLGQWKADEKKQVPTETPRGNYSYVARNNGDLTIEYNGQPGYVYAENAARLDYECEFDATLTNSPSYETYTDSKGYPCLRIKTHGGFGNIRVIQNVHYESTLNSGTKYLLNRKETEIAVGNITVQSYPHTWDFTGYNVDKGSLMSNISSNIGISNNNAYGAWATDNKTAVRSSIEVTTLGTAAGHDYYLGTIDESYNDHKKSIEKPLFADGSELTVGSSIIQETIGLGITAGIVGQYTNSNNTVIGDNDKQLSFDGGCMKSTRGYSITIPNVTAGMYVFVRATKDAAITASNSTVASGFAPCVDNDVTVSIFKASATGDVVLTIPANTSIYKIGVTDQVKGLNKFGYATESRTIAIDYNETKYFSSAANAYYVTKGSEEYTVVFNKVEDGKKTLANTGNKGLILWSDNISSPVNIPLFVPANNISTGTEGALTNNLMIASPASESIALPADNAGYTNYVFTNFYYNKSEGYGVQHAGDKMAFYKQIRTSTLAENKSYLKITDGLWDNPSAAKSLYVFFSFFDEGIEDTPTQVEAAEPAIVEKNDDLFYTIGGMRIDGTPKTKGVYVRNGKKYFVK